MNIETKKRGRPRFQITDKDQKLKQKIERGIFQQTGISLSILAEKSRKGDIAYARALYCYFLRMRTNLALETIGRSINRDYSSVIFAVNNIKELADVYPEVREDIRLIDEQLRPTGITVG